VAVRHICGFRPQLNKAVNKLRDALQDSADQPQFIETLPQGLPLYREGRAAGRSGRRACHSGSGSGSPDESEVRWYSPSLSYLSPGAFWSAPMWAGWRDAVVKTSRALHLPDPSLACCRWKTFPDPGQCNFCRGQILAQFLRSSLSILTAGVLHAESAPPLLQTVESKSRRLWLLASTDDRHFPSPKSSSLISARDFLRDVVKERLHAKEVYWVAALPLAIIAKGTSNF